MTKHEQGWVDIPEFITSGVCRRVILDQVMDGFMGRERCQDDEETCDICQNKEEEAARQVVRDRVVSQFDRDDDSGPILDAGDDRGSEASIDEARVPDPSQVTMEEELEFESQVRERAWVSIQVASQQRQEAIGVRELREQLHRWSGICPLCHWRGHWTGIEHRIEDRRKEAATIATISQDIRKLMKEKRMFQAFGCCTWCGVPQSVCEKWRPREEGGGWEEVPHGRCQHRGVLVPAIVTMLIGGEDGDEAVFQIITESWRRYRGPHISVSMVGTAS